MTRWIERDRLTAECSDCGQHAPGVTRAESNSWGGRTVRHLCDDCIAAVVERPLGAVLADFLD